MTAPMLKKPIEKSKLSRGHQHTSQRLQHTSQRLQYKKS